MNSLDINTIHDRKLTYHPDGCVTVASDWSRPLLKVSNVSVRYDRRTVLSDVNLTVNYGDFMAVTGPNGGGKTSLLRVILSLLRPTTGTLTYYAPDGKQIDSPAIGYLPQKNMVDSQFPIVVREVVASGLLADRSMPKLQKAEVVERMIARIGLEAHADAPIGALSGGQLQRALLGRALVSSPNLLVLDEPLSYLDKRFEARLYEILREVAGDATIILVSHELSQIDHIANRHILVEGTIRECTATHHYISSPCDCGCNRPDCNC